VSLPWRTAGLRTTPSADEHVAAGSAEQHRVLVVEDNTVNQLLVGRQLERLGYEPIIVGSGEAALDVFGREAVDAVLMDWQMPGMNGLEAATHLRHAEKSQGRRRVPIIAMTASAMPGDRERCLDAGMDDFVAKPVNLATLGRTLATWLYPTGAAPTEDALVDTPAAPPAIAVDASVLDRLLEELDDPSLVATVIATYRRELAGRVEAIEDASRAGELAQLKAVAHTLKSTSAALGAATLATFCQQLEELATSDAPAVGPLEPLLARLGAERARVDAALDREGQRFSSLASAGN
jgi:CheY-like chemotaxis protein/HPt (histidine-containing phosphotransfer) domain-containing protein